MLHVSILLFGAHGNQSSRSPASAVLALLLGSMVSFCSFQAGIFLARYRLMSHMRQAAQHTPTPSNGRAENSSKSGKGICAPAGSDLKQPAQSSAPIVPLAPADVSSTDVKAGENGGTHEHAIELQKQQQPAGDAQSCTRLLRGLIATWAAVMVTSSVCGVLAAWYRAQDDLEWASFWLAGLLAVPGALWRWRLAALNSTPKRTPTYPHFGLFCCCCCQSYRHAICTSIMLLNR
jgi:hypothetical protein